MKGINFVYNNQMLKQLMKSLNFQLKLYSRDHVHDDEVGDNGDEDMDLE